MKRLIMFFICISTIIFSPIAGNAQSYLENTSKGFTNVGKKAIPAVVFIKSHFNGSSFKGMDENNNPFDYFNDDFFRKFFGQPPNQFKQQQQQIAGGSGFIVSSDGYIVTNFHVVKDASKIEVILNDSHEYEAKIIGSDPRTDLAVIKIEAKNLPYLEFGDSEDLEIGEWAIAIGSPFQFQSTLTVGVISAKGRHNLRIVDLEDFIQTDAAINPGNSGGPLCNIQGDVIGINTALISQSGGYMGIGFAIPSNMAKHVMEQIITNGSVKRGQLGVYLQPIDNEMAEAFDLKTSGGVLITEVIKDSAAEKAGLKQGDIILEYNGTPVSSMSSFRNGISLMEPGKEIKLTLIRDGKKQVITVTLGQSIDDHQTSNESVELGIEVSDIKDLPSDVVSKYHAGQNIDGVMITSVKYNSLAEKAGLKPGMLLLQLNHKKIKNTTDFKEAIKNLNKNKHVLMLVRYQDVTRFITIKIK